MNLRLAAAALACALALATPASAEPYELRHDVAVDVAVTGTALALGIGSEIAKHELISASCRWCDRDEAGNDTLNGLDRGARERLRWSDTHTARQLSDVTGVLVTPGVTFGMLSLAAADERAGKELAVDLLIVLQAAALSELTDQAAKFSFARERPFVHAATPEERARLPGRDDHNVSFYSGHSAGTFSLAVAAGTVASMRGYRLAPLVWGLGLPVAGTTAYLRVAGDKHYLTDVLVGALVGAAFGALVPLVFHPRVDPATSSGAIAPGVVSAPLLGTGGTF